MFLVSSPTARLAGFASTRSRVLVPRLGEAGAGTALAAIVKRISVREIRRQGQIYAAGGTCLEERPNAHCDTEPRCAAGAVFRHRGGESRGRAGAGDGRHRQHLLSDVLRDALLLL